MLGLPSEVEEVILGRTGLLRNLAPGSIVVDMSTSRPELACRIAGAVAPWLCSAFRYAAATIFQAHQQYKNQFEDRLHLFEQSMRVRRTYSLLMLL
jgi:3-hydroxyisobutyrate dehydrogenase-like beta-hydroxyacid dehydrogenase